MKDSRDIGDLIKALADETREVQEAAAETLEEIGELSVGPLIHALKIDNLKLRVNAARILGKIGEPTIDRIRDNVIRNEEE